MIEQVKNKVLKITFILWILSSLLFVGLLYVINYWVTVLTTLSSIWEDSTMVAVIAIVYLGFNWLMIRSARYEFRRYVKKYWEHHSEQQ